MLGSNLRPTMLPTSQPTGWPVFPQLHRGVHQIINLDPKEHYNPLSNKYSLNIYQELHLLLGLVGSQDSGEANLWLRLNRKEEYNGHTVIRFMIKA